MIATKSSRTRAAQAESALCQFPFADGRRCRMLRHSGHPCLCLFHARAESQLIETEQLGTELAQTISGDFMTATDINFAMGRLYTAVAQNRIPIRNANALARIGRIMLSTVPVIKSEFTFCYKFDEWNKMLDATKPLSGPAHHSLPPARISENPPLSIQCGNSASRENHSSAAQRNQSASAQSNDETHQCKSSS
jgi:hypothetical protein